jgi:DNA-binding ferritin-like protein
VTPEAFVAEMDETLRKLLAVRDTALERLPETAGKADIRDLLRGALRAEMEATEIAALWVPTTSNPEVKLAFARQAGDEAKHFLLIAERLMELGVPREDVYTPITEFSPLYHYLETLSTPAERVGAAQLTREAIGYKSNELFIAYCEQEGDHATAKMYREQIQPDELHHHEWGKRLLLQLAGNEDTQAEVRKAILTTLELADELRSLAIGRLHVETVPGC